MIKEILKEGKKNAQTAGQLAARLNCSVYKVARAIEEERAQGAAIAIGCPPLGYYKPATEAEKRQYDNYMKRRQCGNKR